MSVHSPSSPPSYRGQGRDDAAPMLIVSGDSHVGPRLVEDLRQYCPSRYLDQFDAFVAENNDPEKFDAQLSLDELHSNEAFAVMTHRMMLNRRTAGHYDPDTRLKEMDWDGVAAEVIFHGSQNTQVFPFGTFREYADTERGDRENMAVGYDIYNRWLADFCAADPARLIGLIYPQMWDVELAVKTVRWGAEHGLRGVNLPAPRPGIAGEYDDPMWEPLWAACADLGLTLVTHAGVPMHPASGPQYAALRTIEVGGWPVRRGMHRLIFAGVFERYPDLNYVLTETRRGWWSYTMRDLDDACANPSEALRRQMPKAPSEYMKKNVFIGASFMPPVEVREALDEGFTDRIIWGRDYPHGEGTYKYPEREGEESLTRRYLRWAFAGCPLPAARDMLGNVGVDAYHLDSAALRRIADRIGPAPEEVTTTLPEVPETWKGSLADVFSGTIA